jgi:hypothetical protein
MTSATTLLTFSGGNSFGEDILFSTCLPCCGLLKMVLKQHVVKNGAVLLDCQQTKFAFQFETLKWLVRLIEYGVNDLKILIGLNMHVEERFIRHDV